MKTHKIETLLQIYDTLDDLPEHVQKLFSSAHDARLRAYAPYSKFMVGAALLLENGEIITGNNQENASYPSGICAERTALFYASSQFPDQKIITMAVVAGSLVHPTTQPIPPCGGCRQVISEYEVTQSQSIEIYFSGENGPVARSHSLENLLPFVFDRKVL